MEIFKYHIRVPVVLFPVIAHAIKWFQQANEVEFTSPQLMLDTRDYYDGTAMHYLSQINDFLQLRENAKAFLLAKFIWNKVNCELHVTVSMGVAEMYMKVEE